MLKKVEYNWMRPLYQFCGVLKAFHHDLSRRSWLARTLNDDGTINVAPNAYSPAHCLALLRWALTVDVREQEAAAATAGALQAAFGYDGEIQPRFQVLCETEVLAIALLWGRYGYGAPLQPLREYHHIVVRGMRYDMPEGIQDAPMQPIPPPQAVPFADADYDDTFAGFRDLAATVAGAARERVTGSGMVVADAREDLEFDIDAEGAELFFAIELDRAIHLFDQAASPTAGFLYLARLGVVAFHRGSASEQDRMLRLANQIWRSGIGELLDQPEALVRRLSGSGTLSSSPLQLAF